MMFAMNITTENMGMDLSFFIKELHMEGEKKNTKG